MIRRGEQVLQEVKNFSLRDGMAIVQYCKELRGDFRTENEKLAKICEELLRRLQTCLQEFLNNHLQENMCLQQIHKSHSTDELWKVYDRYKSLCEMMGEIAELLDISEKSYRGEGIHPLLSEPVDTRGGILSSMGRIRAAVEEKDRQLRPPSQSCADDGLPF